jgi:hypothetical protein
MLFNGANVGELFDVSANGGRVRLFRNIANITMDLNDVERIDLRMLGGADTLTVNDLAGTDLALLVADLAAAAGGGADLVADQITVFGSAADDQIDVSAANGGVEVARTGSATVRILNADPTLDLLVVDGLAGSDTINIGAGVSDLIQVSAIP